MVGETRDKETAEMAVKASLTGHFVLSTIHTNDASSAPNRLIDMGVQPFMLASSLSGVLAQRLIRTLCEDCKQPHDVTPFELQSLGLKSIPDDVQIYEAKGCGKCNSTGYSGMTVVTELLMITDEIKSLIISQSDSGAVKRLAQSQGMKTLREDAIEKVFMGITDINEMNRAINSESNASEEDEEEI